MTIVGVDESIVVVCERKDLYARGCAVSRAFPTYSRKTASSNNSVNVSVEFIIVPNQDDKDINTEITQGDIEALQAAAHGIRTAARIVDAPCNEMNVDGFLQEVEKIAGMLDIKPIIICGEELQTKGMGGIYGVGKAATSPPALAVLSHTPAGAYKTIAWVGKSIVYDTGSLSFGI